MKIIKVSSWLDVPENFTGMVEFTNGIKKWYKNGMYHREDGPAIEWADGDKTWYKEGDLHREDGPACEYQDGTRKWYKNGKRHREDGPSIEWASGAKCWHINNQQFFQINLKDHVVLDYYKGKYGIMWYRLLGKDQIFESPDISGLIINHSSSE